MAIFIPYSVSEVISYFSSLFSLDLSSITDYQMLIITLISNIYFFTFWFFIIYFSIIIFNKIYERIF